MKILLVGGGSGGPVAPLIAVAEEIKLKHPQAQFLLVGTKTGPEALMAQSAGIKFVHITAAKLRRYFSWQNIIIPFQLVNGFLEARKIILEFQPDCILGSGSFVQVPVVIAGYFLKTPTVIHQQDVYPGLANKLSQFFVDKITVTFSYNLKSFFSGLGIFYKKKKSERIILTGNPSRVDLRHGSRERGLKEFGLSSELPTLLVLGGGTGAAFLNNLIWEALPALGKIVQIVHATGKGKTDMDKSHENYRQYDFISNMADAYAVADVVLCRAGLSTITELSKLKKLSIIVPIPDSHQEVNARYLARRQAALVLNQNFIQPVGFVNFIRKIIFSHQITEKIKNNIGTIMEHDGTRKISEIVINLALQK